MSDDGSFWRRPRTWGFAALILVVPLAVVTIVWRPWAGCDPADRDSWVFAYELHGTDPEIPKNVRVASEEQTHTIAEEEAAAPQVSPDGTQLLYTVYRNEFDDAPFAQVFVSDLDGSDVRELVPGGGAAWGKWSPDGEQIAFWNSEAGSVEIAAADGSDGANTTVVAVPPGRADIEWSPDGTRLAWGHKNTIAWTELGTGQITEVQYSDSNAGPVTADFAWHPGGEGFILLYDDVDDHVFSPTDAYRVDFEGVVQEQVYEGTAIELFLLPDDTLGAVTDDDDGDELISIDVESGEHETVLDEIGDNASVAACG